MIYVALISAVLLLAYANGANDNFKGLATLWGSRTLAYKPALYWATATTLAGSMASFFLAETLLHNFSGKGLIPPEIATNPAFVAAVALGAGLTVLFSARLGLPISTTHSLVGALCGSGIMAAGTASVDFSRLLQVFLLPLLFSPLLAIGLTGVGYRLAHWWRVKAGFQYRDCLCVHSTPVIQPTGSGAFQPSPAAMAIQPRWEVTRASTQECNQRYVHPAIRIDVHRWLRGIHLFSGGLVSFSRGLNDTPKMLALLLVLPHLNLSFGLLAVALFIALGGLWHARPVAQTMSHRITSLNEGQGVTANLFTSGIVLLASMLGMPVSTTHVSNGALFGVGLVSGNGNARTMTKIVLAWVATLPMAAIAGAITFLLLQNL